MKEFRLSGLPAGLRYPKEWTASGKPKKTEVCGSGRCPPPIPGVGLMEPPETNPCDGQTVVAVTDIRVEDNLLRGASG